MSKNEVRTIDNVLSKIDKLKQHKRKVELLEKEGDFVIKTVLQCCYTDAVDFKMPEGPPPYKPNENEVPITDMIIKQLPKCLNFQEHQWARERKYTQLLEHVSEKDSLVFIAMKDKTLTDLYPSITRELVKEVFPKLIK